MNTNILIEHTSQFNEAIAALIETEAMKAENEKRKIEGLSLAYEEKDFMEVLNRNRLDYNSIVEKRRAFFK